MEVWNRIIAFCQKKAGAVPCDGWYLALQSNVGVDPVVVGHIAAAQVVQDGIIAAGAQCGVLFLYCIIS